MTEVPLKVTPTDFAANKALRPQLVAAAAAKPEAEKKLTIRPLAKRTTGHKLDGDLADWGDPAAFITIGDPAMKLSFDAAYDTDGLYIAYRGTSDLGNASEKISTLFKTGFSMDFQYRSNPNAKGSAVAVGDRRIVIAPWKDKWTATLYDYLDPGTPADKYVEFSSPLITTRVAHVGPLAEGKVAVVVRQPPAKPGERAISQWSAEVFLPWKHLGVRPDPKTPLRCDFGILTPDSGGVRVEKRTYWSNRATDMVADLGMEAQINPAAWGTATFSE